MQAWGDRGTLGLEEWLECQGAQDLSQLAEVATWNGASMNTYATPFPQSVAIGQQQQHIHGFLSIFWSCDSPGNHSRFCPLGLVGQCQETFDCYSLLLFLLGVGQDTAQHSSRHRVVLPKEGSGPKSPPLCVSRRLPLRQLQAFGETKA